MKHFYKIVLTLVFMGITLFGNARENFSLYYTPDTQATEIYAMSNKLVVENLPYSGRLQVFSILGVNVASIDVRSGNGEYSINLPKGYYIVKIGDVVRKIAVK